MKIKQVLLILLSALPAIASASVFTVSGQDILLNGQDFEVKGICYQPTPIGESGTLAPFGDYYTFSTRNQEIWDRDFANIRAMGANVIRVYGWTPGEDHSAFLSQAYNGGEDPVYVLINRYIDPNTNWGDQQARQDLINEWTDIATAVADDPAVMGFLIGNELNVNKEIDLFFWGSIELIADAIKQAAPDKLVSLPITDDLNQIDTYNSFLGSLDFWAMQIYRGDSFGTLITDYTAVSSKPLVITEFGYDALDGRVDTEWPDNAMLPADAVEALWNELRVDDAGDDIVSGACVFEYTDEWWKDTAAGNLSQQDFGPRFSGPFEDDQFNEEWWGIFRVIEDVGNIDILEPRALFYRLAAMWNDPFETVLFSDNINGELEVSFNYPLVLRDQNLNLEMSSQLSGWGSAADNLSGTELVATDGSISLTSQVVGDQVEVTVLKNLGSPGNTELLENPGFETGTTAGWATGGTITSTNPQAGLHALEITAPGTVSIPSAFQSFPAKEGDDIVLSGYLYTDTVLPLDDSTFGLFKIVFKDRVGNDLDPAGGILVGQAGPPEAPGVESLPRLDSASPLSQWVYSEARGFAPKGTASVEIFFLVVDEVAATMAADSVSAQRFAVPGDENPRIYFRLANDGR